MRQTQLTLFDKARATNQIFKIRFTLITTLVISSVIGYAQPKWNASYPSIVSGASSADISVQLNEPGTVYYAVYNTAPTGVTAVKIKTDATGTVGGTIVKNGSISVGAASSTATALLSGLPDNKTYYFCIVAESVTGLQSDAEVKTITKVFPLRQTSNSFRAKLGPNALVGYLAYVPEAYYKDPTAKFPVLLMLHGMGEKLWNPQNISQLNLVRKYGPAMLIDKGQEFPFIVITPQCPFPGWDDVSTDGYRTTSMKPGVFVNEIFDMIESNYRIDKSREYLTGISMGGASVWAYLQEPNNRVAAAIPIAGWGDGNKTSVIASQNTPIWTFQGGSDGGANIQSFVNTINNSKPAPTVPAKVTVYPGMGHNVWDITYNNSGTGIAPDNIYDWLMRYTKAGKEAQSPNQAPVAEAGNDQTITLPVNALTLRGSGSDRDGSIISYSWTQKSGVPASVSGTATSTLSLSGLTEGNYSFYLTVKDDKGATAKDSITIIVKAPEPAPSAGGNGLAVSYFNNKTLTGNPISTQIDTTINFNWGAAAPSGLNTDNFGARWTGMISPIYSELYSFYTTSDDGVRLWVDDQLIIDNWTNHASVINMGTIQLVAGQKYQIKMEYYDNYGGAEARLSWSSASQAKQIVPKDYLFPYIIYSSAAAAPAGSGLTADYFNNVTVAGTPIFSSIDPTVDFLWSNSPAQNVNPDRFSVRWSGQVRSLYAEKYTFYTTSDDGVRLWVNGQLLVDNWNNHASTINSGTIELEANELYDIRMEYFDNYGGGEARLSWSSARQTKQIIPKQYLFPSTESYQSASSTAANALNLYPMPASDLLNVSFTSPTQGSADIKIIDDLSQIRYQTNTATQAGANTVSIDISQISIGVYTLIVTTGGNTHSSRIIITR